MAPLEYIILDRIDERELIGVHRYSHAMCRYDGAYPFEGLFREPPPTETADGV